MDELEDQIEEMQEKLKSKIGFWEVFFAIIAFIIIWKLL